LQLLKRHTITDLEDAIGYGQRVVINSIIGEIAHRKVIDPCYGARAQFSGCAYVFNMQFANKHDDYERAFGPAARTLSGASNFAKFSSNFAASNRAWAS
jgi:hypothetical protein